MSSPSSPSTSRNAERYGRPLVAPRTARVLLIAAAAVFLGLVAFVGVRFADSPVKAEVISYDHLEDHLIGVTFQVTMTPGTPVTCSVQALNAGSAQVGFLEVEIPAQTERRTAHHVEIATQGDAVTAEVIGCDEG
ncbi:DUF4307 domain-containing protein [Brachybacterium sp. DNPG3]